MEERTAKATGEPVDLAVRARTDVLVTAKQYRAVRDAQLPEDRDALSAPRTRDHREQPSRPQLSREPVSAVSGSQDPVAANSTTDERASTR